MWGVELAVMAVMVAINGVFASYEIAMASVSLARLRALIREGRRGAADALYMKENVEASLATVQLGITLFGAVAAATGGAGAEESLSPRFRDGLGLSPTLAEFLAIALVVVPLTAVTILFGELVPKVFALRNKEWVCLKLSTPMRWFSASVAPVVWLFETAVQQITRWGERRWRPGQEGPSGSAELQELHAVAALARASRLIGAREERIILGAARLTSRPVREIALPAANIHTLSADAPLPESLVAAHLDMHTRFPVAERLGDPQSIIGYVTFKDLVAHVRLSPQDPTLRGITRTLLSFQERDNLATCLETMMRERTHIALVCEGKQVTGMITLEDILEELVGEIEDEYDRLPTHLARTGTGWLAGGGVSLQRLCEASGHDLAADLPSAGAETLSAWVEGHLGRPVRGGDLVERAKLRVVVRKARRHHVQEAQIIPLTPGPSASA